ncbi:MAG: thiosulfate sulfurtransferase [Halieaceae bacterium]|jgi:thiosulfate sulfurtransferase
METNMAQFERISTTQAQQMLQQADAQLVDVRDFASFSASRIEGARHLDNTTLQDFIQDGNPGLPVIVYCYHGNSSQSAAAFLNEKGFQQVYSVDGGFEAWRQEHPVISP